MERMDQPGVGCCDSEGEPNVSGCDCGDLCFVAESNPDRQRQPLVRRVWCWQPAESVDERERAADERRLSHPRGADANGRRPTKRDRRQIEALRQGHQTG